MLINNTLFGFLITAYLLVCYPVYSLHQQLKTKEYFCQKERWLIFFLLCDILLLPILLLPPWFPLRVELFAVTASCLLYDDCIGAEKIYLRFARPCLHQVDLQAHRLLSSLESILDGDVRVSKTPVVMSAPQTDISVARDSANDESAYPFAAQSAVMPETQGDDSVKEEDDQ